MKIYKYRIGCSVIVSKIICDNKNENEYNILTENYMGKTGKIVTLEETGLYDYGVKLNSDSDGLKSFKEEELELFIPITNEPQNIISLDTKFKANDTIHVIDYKRGEIVELTIDTVIANYRQIRYKDKLTGNYYLTECLHVRYECNNGQDADKSNCFVTRQEAIEALKKFYLDKIISL